MFPRFVRKATTRTTALCRPGHEAKRLVEIAELEHAMEFLAVQLPTGARFQACIDLSGVPVGEAHLVGAFCGLAAGIWGRVFARDEPINAAFGPDAASAV